MKIKQSKSYAMSKIPSVSGGTPNGTKNTIVGQKFRNQIIKELGIGPHDYISVKKGLSDRKEIKLGEYPIKDFIRVHEKVYNMTNSSSIYHDSNVKKIIFTKSERNSLPFESAKGATEMKKKSKKDPIVQPSHYERYKIEPINFIMLNNLSFWIGNIVKYVVRAGYKEGVDEVTDLLKARRYIDMRLNQLEGKNPNALRD